jgi:hypothetical protein
MDKVQKQDSSKTINILIDQKLQKKDAFMKQRVSYKLKWNQ